MCLTQSDNQTRPISARVRIMPKHVFTINKKIERKIVNIFFLSICLNICFVCSKEPSH